MDAVLEILQWLLANYQPILSALVAALLALIALFLLIPGEQPEKFLQGIVDFLKKLSLK